ncbi:UDP-N-acetylglucosamine transferase subunit ALG14 homolog isoform X1 [Poeciliopsis prolifica]|uniref:UDP-N-acetylglucosamine transferase subunit ALG14 homolog isoform X1 n=1 Tax=Poeciliopsis prolifica TaxID=188132 RepID=UPI002414075B|nr:UDP-N-acetylglucosamine transferase subunit ALG14 homolog isoform X1 [Poeciliopsis prolifica]
MLLFGVMLSFFLTALLFLLRVYFVFNSGSNHPPKTRSHVAVLVVAGSGGHTTEIMRLMESLSAAYTPRHYVIADTDKMSEEKIVAFESSKPKSDADVQFTINRIPRSREVAQSWSSSVVSTLNALRYSLPLVFRLQPDVRMDPSCYDLATPRRVVTGRQDSKLLRERSQLRMTGTDSCERAIGLQPESLSSSNADASVKACDKVHSQGENQ